MPSVVLAYLFKSTGRAIAVTTALAWTLGLMLALVQVFKRLYLLNLWMEEVHTCPDVRYWSEVLCCTIPTLMSDLEVKVTDLEKHYVKVFGSSLRGNAQFKRAKSSSDSSYYTLQHDSGGVLSFHCFIPCSMGFHQTYYVHWYCRGLHWEY